MSGRDAEKATGRGCGVGYSSSQSGKGLHATHRAPTARLPWFSPSEASALRGTSGVLFFFFWRNKTLGKQGK